MDVRESTVATAPVKPGVRARVSGKFIFLGNDKFYVRGVTYGTFRPGTDGGHYPEMVRGLHGVRYPVVLLAGERVLAWSDR